MSQAGLNYAKFHPQEFLLYLRDRNYPIYHKSNIFFRDFQYGLWQFLQESQTKVSYADIEKTAHDLLDSYEEAGIVRKIGRQNFELLLEEFHTEEPGPPGKKSTPPAGSPAAPAAKSAPKSAPAAPASGGASGSTSGGKDPSRMTPEERAARIEEVKRLMAEAKARRIAQGG